MILESKKTTFGKSTKGGYSVSSHSPITQACAFPLNLNLSRLTASLNQESHKLLNRLIDNFLYTGANAHSGEFVYPIIWIGTIA